MVSLKWGDVLSTVLPGAVALLAVSPYFPLLRTQLENPDKIGAAAGTALLIAAALAGGILEALTRVLWEPLWLTRRCRSPDALSSLTAENLELYERGVQSSYKYATFYANFAWATLLLLISRALNGLILTAGTAILVVMFALLLRASHVQWTYYVNYLKRVFPLGLA